MTLATPRGNAHLSKDDNEALGQLSHKDSDSDLLAALCGQDADRDRSVAHRARRVVMSSAGVLKERKRDTRRARSVAMAVAVLVVLLFAPLVWEVADNLIADGHLGDPGSQMAIWACTSCGTLLAAALVAGWWRHRS